MRQFAPHYAVTLYSDHTDTQVIRCDTFRDAVAEAKERATDSANIDWVDQFGIVGAGYVVAGYWTRNDDYVPAKYVNA